MLEIKQAQGGYAKQLEIKEASADKLHKTLEKTSLILAVVFGIVFMFLVIIVDQGFGGGKTDRNTLYAFIGISFITMMAILIAFIFQGRQDALNENPEIVKTYYDAIINDKVKPEKEYNEARDIAKTIGFHALTKAVPAIIQMVGLVLIAFEGAHNPMLYAMAASQLIMTYGGALSAMSKAYNTCRERKLPQMLKRIKDIQKASEVTGSVSEPEEGRKENGHILTTVLSPADRIQPGKERAAGPEAACVGNGHNDSEVGYSRFRVWESNRLPSVSVAAVDWRADLPINGSNGPE